MQTSGDGRVPERARAWWLAGRRRTEIRGEPLAAPRAGEVCVRTLFSGISPGTEALVRDGAVPANQCEAMRAPFQDGDFPWPVKYGYLNVGEVIAGDAELIGNRVFCLYPHQTHYTVPADAVTPLPDDVPSRRAALAGMCETAVNAVWDAEAQIGDRIAIVGAGLLGCMIAGVLAGLPAADIRLYDIDPERAALADRLGVEFALAERSNRVDADIAIHTSATESGARFALDTLVPEGRLVDASWYGDRAIALPLGENFHSRRLTIRSSQVGRVAPRTPPRSHADRMAVALRLLADPRFDALLGDEIPFDDLAQITPPRPDGRLPLVSYPD